MGGVDKPLLDLGGKPLIAHVIERLSAQVDAIVLSCSGSGMHLPQVRLPGGARPIPRPRAARRLRLHFPASRHTLAAHNAMRRALLARQPSRRSCAMLADDAARPQPQPADAAKIWPYCWIGAGRTRWRRSSLAANARCGAGWTKTDVDAIEFPASAFHNVNTPGGLGSRSPALHRRGLAVLASLVGPTLESERPAEETPFLHRAPANRCAQQRRLVRRAK